MKIWNFNLYLDGQQSRIIGDETSKTELEEAKSTKAKNLRKEATLVIEKNESETREIKNC